MRTALGVLLILGGLFCALGTYGWAFEIEGGHGRIVGLPGWWFWAAPSVVLLTSGVALVRRRAGPKK